MSYRDEGEILRERLHAVERALASRRDASERLQEEETRLRTERTQIDRALASRRVLPMLDDVRVASPCTESWSEMSGDDRKRFCGKCEKNVYDLSAMTREEAEVFLAMQEGSVCVRFFRRFDGTILTADCPDGARRLRNRRIAVMAGAAVGAGLFASMAVSTVCMGAAHRDRADVNEQQEMGQVPHTMGSVMPIQHSPNQELRVRKK
jgi:hypothetical protein